MTGTVADLAIPTLTCELRSADLHLVDLADFPVAKSDRLQNVRLNGKLTAENGTPWLRARFHRRTGRCKISPISTCVAEISVVGRRDKPQRIFLSRFKRELAQPRYLDHRHRQISTPGTLCAAGFGGSTGSPHKQISLRSKTRNRGSAELPRRIQCRGAQRCDEARLVRRRWRNPGSRAELSRT